MLDHLERMFLVDSYQILRCHDYLVVHKLLDYTPPPLGDCNWVDNNRVHTRQVDNDRFHERQSVALKINLGEYKHCVMMVRYNMY